MATTGARAGLALALAIVLLGLPSWALVAPTGLGEEEAGASRLASLSSGCAYPLPGPNVSGSLAVDGGPLAPGAAGGVHLTVGYSVPYRIFYPENGTFLPGACADEATNATTLANGSFSAFLATPSDTCTMTAGGWACEVFSRPCGPVVASAVDPLPTGYAWSQRTGSLGLELHLAFVWELAYVTIAPAGGTVTLSADAPTTFVATGRMANGTATPLAPTFSWSLEGNGWSFDGAPGGASARVVGVAGAAVGNLSVQASAWIGSTWLHPPAAAVTLVDLPTDIVLSSIEPTTVDATEPTSVELEGTGAAGYAYRAYVDPGLGLDPVAAPCSIGPSAAGEVSLACVASFAYPAPGLATPSANLTNGFSTATAELAPVTVVAPPALSVVPAEPEGYPGVPVTVALQTLDGTGVDPYAEACLDPGAGPTVCEATPGPAWSFRPVYPAPGQYHAVAWAVDGAGTNRSIVFAVTIVPPLALGPIALGSANMTVGVPVRIAASVAGGALPARFWWNVSGAPGLSTAGSLSADGNLSTEFVPGTTGVVGVSLAVADALGQVVREDALFAVSPPPAVRVVSGAAPPSAPVVDGTLVALGWEALDPSGDPATSFAPTTELLLRSSAGTLGAYVNASASGPLDPVGPGEYAVPSAAWFQGRLDLTIEPTSTGTVCVTLAGAALPDQPPSVNLSVVPDDRDVRLFAPVVARDQARSNATFWHVEDRFGNAVPGALLSVVYQFGGTSSVQRAAAVPLPGGGSGVWINFTAPASGGGTVSVVDGAGVTLLGPIPVPAARPTAAVPAVAVAAVSAPLGVAVGLFAVARRRRRGGALAATDDGGLRRLAEGRDALVGILRRIGPADLATIEAAWRPAPAPPELADWLASLVADGSLGATLGPDRRARFRVARGAPPPRIELDPERLAEALRRRDEDTLRV